MHVKWFGTKETLITVFDQQHMRIMAEVSSNRNATTLKERAENQSIMLRDENALYIVFGGARHQTRRIVGKEGRIGTA